MPWDLRRPYRHEGTCTCVVCVAERIRTARSVDERSPERYVRSRRLSISPVIFIGGIVLGLIALAIAAFYVSGR